MHRKKNKEAHVPPSSKVNPQQKHTTMDNRSLEDRIAAELCDLLDDPEAYEGCVLGINKKTLEVSLASPMTFNKEFDTYPVDAFLTNNEYGDIDLDLTEINYVASRFE